VRTDVTARPRQIAVLVPLLAVAAVALLTLQADRLLGLASFAVIGDPRLPWSSPWVEVPSLLSDVATASVLVVVVLLVRVLGRPASRGARFAVLTVGSAVALQVGAAVARTVTGVTVATDLYVARTILLAGTSHALLVVLDSLLEHRTITGSLTEATARAESLAGSSRAALERLRDDVSQQVREVLRDALGTLSATSGSGSGARLRGLADQVLRPLSHRLASAPVAGGVLPGAVARPGWRDTIASVGTTPVIASRSLALLATTLAFLRTLVTDQEVVRDLVPDIAPGARPDIGGEGLGFGVTVDGVELLTSVAELGLILVLTWWGGARFAELLERDRHLISPAVAWLASIIGLAGVATLTLAGPALFATIRGTTADDIGLVTFLASFVPLLVVTLGVSLVGAVERDRMELQHALAWQSAAATRAAARLQAVVGHEQQRLARALHADVQAAVNAGSLMLDRADRDGTVGPELIDDVAARIAVAVERFLGGSASQQPFVERLAGMRTLWDGVCRIRTDVADDVRSRLDADVVARELVVDLVAEACANAVVHGGAQEIGVTVALVPDDEVELRVEDDGSGVAPGAVPSSTGLGSAVLRSSCTRFALERTPQGSALTASVPLG
jgi:hypothetical protein